MAGNLVEREEQVVRIYDGIAQAERIEVDLHDPLEPAHRLRAVIPHVIELHPTDSGLQVDITANRGPSLSITDKKHVELQPDSPFVLGFEKPTVIGDSHFGVMRSMAKVLRRTPDKTEGELVAVDGFEFEDLDEYNRLVVDLGGSRSLNLKPNQEEEAKAELEYRERGVIYRKVHVPVVDLGKRVRRGVEDQKLKNIMNHGLKISAAAGALVVAGLYIGHKLKKD